VRLASVALKEVRYTTFLKRFIKEHSEVVVRSGILIMRFWWTWAINKCLVIFFHFFF
jgi:hypothetical protein